MQSRTELKCDLIKRKLKQINLFSEEMITNPSDVTTATIKDLRYFVDGLETMLEKWERNDEQ